MARRTEILSTSVNVDTSQITKAVKQFRSALNTMKSYARSGSSPLAGVRRSVSESLPTKQLSFHQRLVNRFNREISRQTSKLGALANQQKAVQRQLFVGHKATASYLAKVNQTQIDKLRKDTTPDGIFRLKKAQEQRSRLVSKDAKIRNLERRRIIDSINQPLFAQRKLLQQEQELVRARRESLLDRRTRIESRFGKANIQARKLLRTVKQIARKLRTWMRPLQKFYGRVLSLSHSLRKMGFIFEHIGRSATYGLTIPLVAAAYERISSLLSYETGVVGVAKTTEATAQQQKLIQQAVNNVMSTTPFGQESITSAMRVVGQSGIFSLGAGRGVDVEGLTEYTEQMLKLHNTLEPGSLSVQELVYHMARFTAIMGTAGGEVNGITYGVKGLTSTLTELGNRIAADEAEILQGARKIAGISKRLGFQQHEVFAASAAFKGVGIPTEVGGTSTNRLLLELEKLIHSVDTKLTGRQRTLASVLGFDKDIEAMKKAFKENPFKVYVSMFENLADIAEDPNIQGAESLLQQFLANVLKLPGARVARVVGTQVAAQQESQHITKVGRIAEQAALLDKTEEEYRRFFNTAAGGLKNLRNLFKVIFTEHSDTFLSLIKDFIEYVKQEVLPRIAALVNTFVSLNDEQKKFVLGLGGALIALGPVLFAFGFMITLLGSIVPLFNVIINTVYSFGYAVVFVINKSIAVIRLMNVALLKTIAIQTVLFAKALAGWIRLIAAKAIYYSEVVLIGSVVAAILTGLGFIIYELSQHWDSFKEKVSSVFSWIEDRTVEFYEFVSKPFKALGDLLSKFGGWLGELYGPVAPWGVDENSDPAKNVKKFRDELEELRKKRAELHKSESSNNQETLGFWDSLKQSFATFKQGFDALKGMYEGFMNPENVPGLSKFMEQLDELDVKLTEIFDKYSKGINNEDVAGTITSQGSTSLRVMLKNLGEDESYIKFAEQIANQFRGTFKQEMAGQLRNVFEGDFKGIQDSWKRLLDSLIDTWFTIMSENLFRRFFEDTFDQGISSVFKIFSNAFGTGGGSVFGGGGGSAVPGGLGALDTGIGFAHSGGLQKGLTMLTTDKPEFVVNPKATRENLGLLRDINAGRSPSGSTVNINNMFEGGVSQQQLSGILQGFNFDIQRTILMGLQTPGNPYRKTVQNIIGFKNG